MSPKSKTEELKLEHFHFSVDDDGVATVLLDVQAEGEGEEKVNTLSPRLSADLDRVLERLESDARIRAIVIGSAKPAGFLAGADVKVLLATTSARQATELSINLQKAFARLERLHLEHGKPVVAAIHGPALGGGLELALACSQRVASDSPKTVLGVPEVQLGVIPGAGGTQRLPRLVGIAKALDMILTARHVRPHPARKMGLVDEIVPESIVLAVARKRALKAANEGEPKAKRGIERLKALAQDLSDPDHLQQLALEENPVGQRVLFRKAREQMLKKSRGNYPALEKALEVVRMGIQEGLEAGYVAEADRFGQLAVSSEARALMSIFFGMQELKKDSGVDNPEVKARPVRKVGVLGGGLMGGGVAAVTLTKAKLPVRLREVDGAGLGRGFAYVQKLLNRDVRRKRRSPQEAERLINQMTGTLDLSGFKRADVVIEAVFEDLQLKHKVLREVEECAGAETIFASNTSSLPISEIAKASKHPETVIGMHYFSPVEKMPLLEIIVTDKTADWVTATCVQLGKDQGKSVIVVRDGTGFYTSRILAPYMNEAAWALAEGASVQAIDEAMMNWGYPVGPVVLLDEIGIDVAAKVAKIMQKAFGDRMQAPGTMDTLIDDNRLGRKNGRGFYRYEKGKKAGPDESVYAALGQSAKRTTLRREELQLRLGLQMVNEAARCLEEGILRSPRDGDIGAVFGLGFPPFTGGPFSYVDHVGASEVVHHLERFAERYGERFAPAQILKQYAKEGKRFRS